MVSDTFFEAKYIPAQYRYMIMQTLFYLREYFFPAGCGGCGESLLTTEDCYYGLCGECRVFFEAAITEKERCGICGRPLISEREICLSCRAGEESRNGFYNNYFVKLRTLFPYKGKFRTMLGAYKFGKSLGVGNFLAKCLYSIREDFEKEAGEEAAWVPVPPRPGKIRKQGWDQIEYMAALLGKAHKRSGHSFPVYRCLKRLPSRSQKELNRQERSTNLKGRILCTRKPPKTAIIFDDVITTGATLNACAEALLEAGTEKVYGVCLFYD